MTTEKSKTIGSSFFSILHVTAPAVALLLCLAAAPVMARADDEADRRALDLPSPACDSLQVPAGSKLSLHAYALGVQIYQWNGTKWAFIAPAATLFADPCYEEQIGTHYAGPTWESDDGSKVVGARLAACTPYRGAIPWLLLGGNSPSGRGKFGNETHIQRVNTIGGTAPAEAGAFLDDEARVPYTAEYYFSRGSKR